MFEYLLKRIGMAAVTLLVILLVSYMLVRMAPGGPTKSSFLSQSGADASGLASGKGAFLKNTTLEKKLHLDKPAIVGFGYWIKDVVLHGDFGDSAVVDKGRPVLDLILERLPVTLSLNICSVLVVYFLALQIGIYSAISKSPKIDNTVTIFLFFLYSLMNVWVALLLQAAFCSGGVWEIFPLRGLEPSETWGRTTWQILWDTAMHYVLPVFCLSYAGIAGLSRYARAGMLEVIKQDYIRTARAKGLPEFVVIFKHALRNAMIILITLFAGLLPGLVAGSIIIEHIFNIPGMGSLSMMALGSRDIPVLMTLFSFGGFLTLAGILVADLLYVVVDPRISFETKR